MINKELHQLISEGEHQQQDFKYAISDSKKIARSLVAFANTDGGSLLLGVKDNGKVVGVSSDEEFYMIEAAANLYCKPAISFETYEWKSEGKTVLQIKVNPSDNKPHKAPNKEGKYMVYIRSNDQNLLANKILLEVWKSQKRNQNPFLQLNEAEQLLLHLLENQKEITFSRFYKQAKISRYKAERILVNLICMNIVRIHITEKKTFYTLREQDNKDVLYG